MVPGLNEAATVIDIPLPVNIPCSNTVSTQVGGTCSVDTSANAVAPGAIPDGGVSRAVIEVNQVQVMDGGQDGQVSTATTLCSRCRESSFRNRRPRPRVDGSAADGRWA